MEKNEIYKCPFCGAGNMITKTMDYEFNDSLNNKVVIPDVEIDICDTCGEKFFGYEAAKTLEAVKKKGNRVTLYLKPDLQKRIKKLAEKHETSFDEEVNSLLETSVT